VKTFEEWWEKEGGKERPSIYRAIKEAWFAAEDQWRNELRGMFPGSNDRWWKEANYTIGIQECEQGRKSLFDLLFPPPKCQFKGCEKPATHIFQRSNKRVGAAIWLVQKESDVGTHCQDHGLKLVKEASQ